jgi:hypothetical protein
VVVCFMVKVACNLQHTVVLFKLVHLNNVNHVVFVFPYKNCFTTIKVVQSST